jgi:diaminopimelate epimerase
VKYQKYHALGNDYIVLSPSETTGDLNPEEIRLLCHRNYGIGSDGILYGPLESKDSDFSLRIFNPDGSEAEKSGNGIRIFARSLWDKDLVLSSKPFSVETLGGIVSCTVDPDGRNVTVEMGTVSFDSNRIPVFGTDREVLNEVISCGDHAFKFCAATVGNPHCIVFSESPSSRETKKYGPIIENDPRFPNKTNVQFLKILDRNNIRIEIWERGAGYTLASGSSSTAAAAVALRLGFCDNRITVHMPGGEIKLTFSEKFSATMTGPVTKVCEGTISREMF